MPVRQVKICRLSQISCSRWPIRYKTEYHLHQYDRAPSTTSVIATTYTKFGKQSTRTFSCFLSHVCNVSVFFYVLTAQVAYLLLLTINTCGPGPCGLVLQGLKDSSRRYANYAVTFPRFSLTQFHIFKLLSIVSIADHRCKHCWAMSIVSGAEHCKYCWAFQVLLSIATIAEYCHIAEHY